MEHRAWFRRTLLGIWIELLVLVGATCFIDPIEIWETPVVRGFNHIKSKQVLFLDVCKPFQVWRRVPDVLYIGSSRVHIGIKPETGAYNLGVNALTLPDMKEYLRLVYARHVPRKIFIGLDLYQFAKESMERKREGFSQSRLDRLKVGSRLLFCYEALKVNSGMTNYLKETVEESWLKRDNPSEWMEGYYVQLGEQDHVDGSNFRYHLHRFHSLYTNFTYDPNSLICLQKILQEAKELNVEVVLFFNPIPVDLIALQNICHREQEFRNIKMSIAQMHPIYDFSWVSSLTIHRKNGWADGSHYRRIVGDRMKESMTGEVDTEICRVLTAETVDIHLQEEMLQYEKWAAGNQEYIRALADVAPQKIPEGELEQFLGF